MFTDLNLATERLIIRPFAMEDAQAFHHLLSQEEVVRYLPEEVMPLEEATEILTWLISCYEKNTPQRIIKYTVAVTLKDSGEVIGWGGFGPLDFDPEQIELYYGLGHEHWGKGYATESASAMLDYARQVVRLPKVIAVVHPENTASIKVLEKLGLTHTRTVRDLGPDFADYEGDLYYESVGK